MYSGYQPRKGKIYSTSFQGSHNGGEWVVCGPETNGQERQARRTQRRSQPAEAMTTMTSFPDKNGARPVAVPHAPRRNRL